MFRDLKKRAHLTGSGGEARVDSERCFGVLQIQGQILALVMFSMLGRVLNLAN